MPKPEKEANVARLKALLQGTEAVLVTGFRGLTVVQMNELRNRLREAQTEYHVVKNTLTRLAAQETGLPQLPDLLEGPVALAFVGADPVQTAKILADFRKDNEEKLVLLGGIMAGRTLTTEDVIAMASLPPRPVLLARMVGAFQAPISGLVNVLQGTLRGLVYALDAIAKKKEKAA